MFRPSYLSAWQLGSDLNFLPLYTWACHMIACTLNSLVTVGDVNINKFVINWFSQEQNQFLLRRQAFAWTLSRLLLVWGKCFPNIIITKMLYAKACLLNKNWFCSWENQFITLELNRMRNIHAHKQISWWEISVHWLAHLCTITRLMGL